MPSYAIDVQTARQKKDDYVGGKGAMKIKKRDSKEG